MSQKLAVIGVIKTIEPIEGADRIRKATVDCADAGQWTGVVGLDHYVGELVTVFLQDALLPPNERWSFMGRHNWRVRMARFKGVPSEAVIIPGAPELPVGTDLAEALGVTKYSRPMPASLGGDAVGPFPSFIPKTDEPNFQVVPELVAKMNEPWVATLKCDGSSCTVWKDEAGELHVASRNLELKEFNAPGAGNSYWRAARKYDWSHFNYGWALQFEVVGPGIQGNPLGLKDVEGRAFTVYGLHYGRIKRMSQSILEASAEIIGMPIAPVVATGTGVYAPEELRKLAEVTYPTGKPGEGIVIRSLDHSVSFKVLNLLYKESR